jgi:hypothetical protein
MNEIIEKLKAQENNGLKPIVELVCNTIKAKAYYKEGGWRMVDEKLGDKYLNPNYSISDIGLCMKMRELNLPILVCVTSSMLEIQNLVNKYFEYKIVEYRIDRLNHYFHVNL